MPEKSPVVAATFVKPVCPNTSRHSVIWVAVAREFVSNLTEPAKSIVPFMGLGVACASRVHRALLTRPAASTAHMVFVRFFIP